MNAEKYLIEKIENLGVVKEGAKDSWYLNQYKCSECGDEWENEDDSMMNDRCPKCHAEIEPFKSTPIEDAVEEIEEKKLSQAEIEAEKEDEEDEVEKIKRPKGELRKGERFGEQYEGIQYGEKFLTNADRWMDRDLISEDEVVDVERPNILNGLSDDAIKACLRRIAIFWFNDNGEFNINKEHDSDSISEITRILTDYGIGENQ